MRFKTMAPLVVGAGLILVTGAGVGAAVASATDHPSAAAHRAGAPARAVSGSTLSREVGQALVS